MAETKEISSDELAVYDRQIRLWGLDAQNRLRNSSALIYGMTPLGAEIGKNLMLCGLNALTVADGCLVGENDANFLIDVKKDVGKNRAKASHDRLRVLNPLVKLETVQMRLIELTPDYLKKYDLVILIDQGKDIIKSVDAVCRENKIRFIAGGIFGWTGYAFFDFDGFEFLIPAPKDHALVDEQKEDEKLAESPTTKKSKLDDTLNGKNIETVTLEEDNAKIKKLITYPSFVDSSTFDPAKLTKGLIRRLKPANFIIANACLHLEHKLGREISAEDFRDFVKIHANNPLQKLATDALKNDFEVITDPPLPATSAIVGGVLAQEAIKALSQNDIPHKNFFAYNAVESMGYIYDLPLIK
uniref:THIF-type NAD/FAD binding fold domain-containing protein n=1 Tax=Panagrolaimus sp. PS1159 TaxID=55785 RepID=A0AC35GS37_9BILA